MAAGSDTSGTKEVNFADCDEIKPATDSTEGEYIFKLDTNPEQGSGPEGEKVLHWYARYTDTEPVSAARKKRYGILTLKNPIDIKDERFLTFQVYVDPGDSGGDLSSTTCIWNCWMKMTSKKAALAHQALTAQRMARSK